MALVVLPVVQDPRQQVDVAAGWDRGDEVAAHPLAPVGHAGVLKMWASGLDHVVRLVQHTAKVWMRPQDLDEQCAPAAADVYHR